MNSLRLSGGFASLLLLSGLFVAAPDPNPVQPSASAEEIETSVRRAQMSAGLDAAES